jgi:flagellar hook-associated protein 3 FlgL
MSLITNSTAAFFRRSLGEMSDLRAQAESLQQQVGTGERLERSSEDPIASARLRQLSRADRLAEVESGNADRAREELATASERLDNIANALIRARELAVLAGNDTTSPSAREAVAVEIESLRDEILASLNAVSNTGRGLFAGESSGPAYTLDAAGTAVYSGTATNGLLNIGDSVEVERGLTGPAVVDFNLAGAPTNTLAFLADLAAGLRTNADPAQFARDSVAGIDAAIDTSTRGQTVIGARLAWIDTVDTNQQLRADARAQEGSAIGDTDLASAITQLQQVLTVLEASQASFARLSSLTLFDRI